MIDFLCLFPVLDCLHLVGCIHLCLGHLKKKRESFGAKHHKLPTLAPDFLAGYAVLFYVIGGGAANLVFAALFGSFLVLHFY